MIMHGVPSETSPARERDEMMVPCRCCGRPLIDALTVEEIIVAAALSPLHGELIRILAKAKGQWLSSFDIARALYADDIDGGPLAVSTTISQHVRRIKGDLAAVRSELTLQSNGTAPGFRLIADLQSRPVKGYRWGRPL